MKQNKCFAKVSITAALIAILALLTLHLVSTEISPSWHMISEYAYSSNAWLLTIFFVMWAVSGWAAVFAIAPLTKNKSGKVGITMLVLFGVGSLMGALFDVRHNLHGLAFGLGVPTLPIAALILSKQITRFYPQNKNLLRFLAHATWISVVLMAVTLISFIGDLRASGAFHPEVKQLLLTLPAGVTTTMGYFNRLLVLLYSLWLIAASATVLKIEKR